MTGDDDNVRAGEYVLGVLDARERREAEARMRDDAAFAQEVQRWEARFAPWLAPEVPVEPSALVWARIRRAIDRAPTQAQRRGLWQDTAFWRAATGLAMAAALAAVAIGLRAPSPEALLPSAPPTAQSVIVLARDDGAPGWLATIDANRHELRMVPVPTPLPDGDLASELWLIAPGRAPRSLGEVSSALAHTVRIPVGLQEQLVRGALLAVTVEPRAGIPHAAPTGAIVAKGEITML